MKYISRAVILNLHLLLPPIYLHVTVTSTEICIWVNNLINSLTCLDSYATFSNSVPVKHYDAGQQLSQDRTHIHKRMCARTHIRIFVRIFNNFFMKCLNSVTLQMGWSIGSLCCLAKVICHFLSSSLSHRTWLNLGSTFACTICVVKKYVPPNCTTVTCHKYSWWYWLWCYCIKWWCLGAGAQTVYDLCPVVTCWVTQKNA